MIRRPPRSTLDRSSAASDVYKRQALSSIAEAIEQKKIQQQEAKRVGNQQLEAELTMEIIQLARQLKAQ